jgi:hypothetical protein
MKIIKTYTEFKESIVLDLIDMSIDLLESMNIWHDALLSSISAEEKDIYDTLKLSKDFYKNRLTLDFISNNIEFINSLSSLALKKSQVQLSDDYSTFLNKPCKWMFIYDISSNELQDPIYIAFEIWDDINKKWSDIKFYKVNGNSKNFYDKLSSKTIEILDANINYIYSTSDGNTWQLQNIEKVNDIYKKEFNKEELQKLLNDRKVKINII